MPVNIVVLQYWLCLSTFSFTLMFSICVLIVLFADECNSTQCQLLHCLSYVNTSWSPHQMCPLFPSFSDPLLIKFDGFSWVLYCSSFEVSSDSPFHKVFPSVVICSFLTPAHLMEFDHSVFGSHWRWWVWQVKPVLLTVECTIQLYLFTNNVN